MGSIPSFSTTTLCLIESIRSNITDDDLSLCNNNNMSRFVNSQNIVVVTCDAALNKTKSSFEGPIRENMANCVTSATRLRNETGDIEDTLLQMVKSMGENSELSQDDIHKFMQGQRDKMKRIAEMNVENDREYEVLMDSVRTLKQVEIQNADAADPQGNEESDPGEKFKEIYAQKQAEKEQNKIEMHQEKHFREVCEEMGERVGPVGDDDIEMVHNQTSQHLDLKCPITGSPLTDPVKNKLCSHVYSRSGIEGLMQQARGRACKCPVYGCGNAKVTREQLEDDLVTAQRVKKEMRRKQHQASLQSSQAENVDADEEDE